MSRPQDPGAFDNNPRTVRRITGDAPACFRDFMGYHGISRAVKEMGGLRLSNCAARLIQHWLGLKKRSEGPTGAQNALPREPTG